MIKSLVIRQIFRLTDLALVIGVLVIGFLVVKLFLTPLPTLEPGPGPEASEDADVASAVAPQENYKDMILFGEAGKSAGESGDDLLIEGEGEQGEARDTTLPLKLRGTIALKPDDPFASAFIENLESRDGVRPFLLGQEVIPEVILSAIYQREVTLLNKGEPERLRMEDTAEGEQKSQNTAQLARRPIRPGTPPVPERPESRSGGGVQHTRLKRDEVLRKALENYSSLSTISPKVETDESGNVLGLTADNIGQHPLAREFGFQDGDVLQTVNNERIDSREKLLQFFQEHQNDRSFRIGILRNGQPNVLVFDVE